jgi:hypothetical protein
VTLDKPIKRKYKKRGNIGISSRPPPLCEKINITGIVNSIYRKYI